MTDTVVVLDTDIQTVVVTDEVASVDITTSSESVVVTETTIQSVDVTNDLATPTLEIITQGAQGVQGIQGIQGVKGDAGQALTPNFDKISGNYYDNSPNGGNSSSFTLNANSINLAPMFVSRSFSIDRIGVFMSSIGSQAKMVIYSAGGNGFPDELLYESSSFNINSTGYKYENIDFTFESNTSYWVGIRSSGSGTCYSVPVNSQANFGTLGSTGGFYYSMIRRTLTFATAATNPWAFTSTDLISANPPSIRMRAS